MGRQLASYDNITYSYNENGIRTSKTVNGVTTKFSLDGTRIIEQDNGTNPLHFLYDRNNEVIGFFYCGQTYLYAKNLQGDITAIINDEGFLFARYTYDDWGNCTVYSAEFDYNNIANLNPFRYRSYYYDVETGLYYLQSRYYDPETGRFINCDDVNYIGASITELSYNAFAYCENEPVNGIDPYGLWGADIHYGSKYHNEKYGNSVYSGTYEWAMGIGWNSVYSDKLAYACRYTDIKRGVAFISCWKYHFDTDKSDDDSRKQIYNTRLEEAVKKFKNAKNDRQRYAAIEVLGEGLHALQDYYAHGAFVPSKDRLVHESKYDNPYYDWKNKNRNSFSQKLSSLGNRYNETYCATLIYLVSFMVQIGEKNSAIITAPMISISITIRF